MYKDVGEIATRDDAIAARIEPIIDVHIETSIWSGDTAINAPKWNRGARLPDCFSGLARKDINPP
jgi:hypothetical protein